MSKKILIVEDDRDLANLVSLHLSDLGFETSHVENGNVIVDELSNTNYDLVILDIMLPGKDGLTICSDLRAKGLNTPVLFLTARGDQEDKLQGFKNGGDDYMAKPFCINELAARVSAMFRRQEWNDSAKRKLAFRNLSIDLIRQSVARAGKSIDLTSIEFRLLSFLAQNADRAVTREELLKEVWGYQSSAYDQTVNTHINRLRSKIEENPAEPEIILTVWGTGYQLGMPTEGN